MSPLIYTSRMPTEAGDYYFRPDSNSDARLVTLVETENGLSMDMEDAIRVFDREAKDPQWAGVNED